MHDTCESWAKNPVPKRLMNQVWDMILSPKKYQSARLSLPFRHLEWFQLNPVKNDYISGLCPLIHMHLHWFVSSRHLKRMQNLDALPSYSFSTHEIFFFRLHLLWFCLFSVCFILRLVTMIQRVTYIVLFLYLCAIVFCLIV